MSTALSISMPDIIWLISWDLVADAKFKHNYKCTLLPQP